MSNIVIIVILIILFGWIFGITFAWIDFYNDLKRLEYLVKNLNDRQHHNEFREDYICEKVSDLMREIKQIKGQIFTVDEEGEE